MDFLDPIAKKRRAIRMMIGYVLMGILISIGTIILVFQTYGFYIDRKTGEVLQNGLVFVDSSPDKASIFLNGKQHQDRTNNRLTLLEGKYDLLIKKDGYRDWRRSFELLGGSVERFTYPLLLPTKLEQKEVAAYKSPPSFTSQSPDKRWLFVSQGASLGEFLEYDLNNVSKTSNKPAERVVTFPSELFAGGVGQRTIEPLEWSSDNKHLLIKHTLAGSAPEFIVLNREAPEASTNINKHLKINPTSVSLRDKKFDQWYIYSQVGGLLQTADAKKNSTLVANNVGVFKSHDADTIIYSQALAGAKTQRIFIKQDKNTYPLRDVSLGMVALDIARYDHAWYLVLGSDGDKKAYIYKDPFAELSKKDGSKPAISAVLRTQGPLNWVAFSQNTRFIVAQSGQHIETYDAEYKDIYRYDIADKFDEATKLTWMDGHRLLGRSEGQIIIFDFDGANKQKLVPVLGGSSTFFDRDYKVLYSLNNSSANQGAFGLMRTDLRLDQDK